MKYEMNDLKSTKIKIEIEFTSPYQELEPQDPENKTWLCPENLKILLKEKCKNIDFEVREID